MYLLALVVFTLKMTKRKFEEEVSEDSLDKEMEDLKNSEEWKNMDKSERRRFGIFLIAYDLLFSQLPCVPFQS